jgi:hypothetical protein
MLDNWDSQDLHLIPQAQERSRSTTSVASAGWRSSDVDIAMDISSDHVSQVQAVTGGIPSDDDEVEHQEVATRVMNSMSSASGVRFRVRANLNSHFLKIDTRIFAEFI